MPDTAPSPPVSRNCDRERHDQCLGTVYIYPRDGQGRSLVQCSCPTPDCGHGSDLERSRRR